MAGLTEAPQSGLFNETDNPPGANNAPFVRLEGYGLAGGGAPATIASANSDTLLLAANQNRANATIYNASTAILYVLLGTGVASSTNYSFQIAANSLGTVPAGYLGAVRGVWASVNGNALITEFT